ncbi:ABC transporter ATP-binding protein [Desulfuribacillus alkaliarsenatis]|uniref:ABC transporter ATP-binding protein n=1 Tax=Desulfuribacillus alkaliarsenatis TaxID=766136 RepID=UPI0015B42158|nr:ABC transporter ATP-binding protein [Desulfuribacillus alkaliarsenatis]
MSDSSRLILKGIYKSYGEQSIIENLSVSFEYNGIYSLFGPSGCGKTTLLHGMLGIVPFDQGDISGLSGRRIAVVFQEERLLPWSTVEQNVLLVLKHHYPKELAKQKVDYYLEAVNLINYKHSYPRQLSGGMRQRVAIARALAYGGEVLILDEPFKGLDIKIKTKIMDLIRQEYKQANKICLLVTHDRFEADYLADEVYYFEGPPLKLNKT